MNSATSFCGVLYMRGLRKTNVMSNRKGSRNNSGSLSNQCGSVKAATTSDGTL
jgi:hypothetical protein